MFHFGEDPIHKKTSEVYVQPSSPFQRLHASWKPRKVVTVTAQEVRENGWLIIFGKVYSVKEQLLPRKNMKKTRFFLTSSIGKIQEQNLRILFIFGEIMKI